MFPKPFVLASLLTVFVVARGTSAAPYLGLYLDPSLDAAQKGAVIRHVIPGSPAERDGLKTGDCILVVNDLEMTDAEKLIETVASFKAGDKLKIKVERDGQEKELTVTLGERPKGFIGRVPWPARPMLGIALQPPDESGKLIVVDVLSGSPAEKAGIKAGDVLREFEGNPLESYRQLAELTAGKKAGDEVVIKVERNGETLEMTAKLAILGPRGGREQP